MHISKKEILETIDNAFRELESQKYALDQSAIVAITDTKGNIIYVNEQFCKISKYSEEELIGQNHRIINSGFHPKSFFEEMWRTISHGQVWHNEIKNKAKDGSYYWVSTTITPYIDEAGKPHMYVSIRFDITKQKEMEMELEEKLKERTVMLQHLSDQNVQLEDFCHIISHNLRAPLSNLLLLSDMIERTENLDEKLVFVSKLKPVIDFLQETFEELVNATQTRMDYTVKKSKIDLNDCVEKILDTLQGEIISSKCTINYDFSKASTIIYPVKYINSILFNIIHNAIKYRSPERTAQINIYSYVDSNSYICIDIKDNGLGIDLKKYGSKIFKLRKTFHNRSDAKGFGLFITKTQIEAMGAKINVKSIQGKGSTFTIQLYKQ